MKDKLAKAVLIGFLGILLIVGIISRKIKLKEIIGIETLSASTLNYDYSKFYVAGVDALGQNQSWTSAMNLGDYYRYEEQIEPYLSAIRVRFGANNNFQANTTYLVSINTIFGTSGNGSFYEQARSVICQGSRTSTWSSDENLVSCEYVGKSLYNDNKNARYYFKITPTVNVYGLQIAWYYKKPPNNVRLYLPTIQNIRVLASSKIEYDNSTSDSINNSTTSIINNNDKNTEKIIENQKELLGQMCPNLFGNDTVINGWIDGTTWSVYTNGNNRVSAIPCEPNTTYTITRKVKTNVFRVGAYDSRTLPTPTTTETYYTIENAIKKDSDTKITYTTGPNAKWLLINFGHVNNDSSTIAESYASIMVIKGSNEKPFCEFGSYQSKIDETNNAINSYSDDDESSSCGIICKLKSIVSFLKPTSLINLIVPTNQQMTTLIQQVQNSLNQKLGILGLPISIYTNVMNLAENVNDTNWCINWNGVKVPNFEDTNINIIPEGQFCFNTLLQNNTMNTLRNFSLYFTGSLILLSFLQYLKNCKNRILDIPDRDEYTYFTQEDVYTVNTTTGEIQGHQIKNRTTRREKS